MGKSADRKLVLCIVALFLAMAGIGYLYMVSKPRYGPESVDVKLPVQASPDTELAGTSTAGQRDTTGMTDSSSRGRLSADSEDGVQSPDDDEAAKPDKPRKRPRKRPRRRGVSEQDDEEEEVAPRRSAPKRSAPYRKR